MLAAAGSASAQDPYMHIFTTDTVVVREENPYGGYSEKYLGKFSSIPMSAIDSTRFLKQNGEFFRMRVQYTNAEGKSIRSQTYLKVLRKLTVGANPATFNFSIPSNPALDDVQSKTEYLDADLTIEGFGACDDFSGTAKIRGRGNSTWNMPKKAYRIKLPEKTKLCGFRKAKNYVLLANYIDLSMMRNEVAALTSQLVEMPYPTHAKPVNVYFNDKYKGSYMLMEKVGINNGSVNIPAAQEAESIMFELDVNYDEELRSISPRFHLPLMHKDPDAPADPAEAKQWFADWADDFAQMEQAVAEGRNIGDYVDYSTLAKFLIVFNLACNQEINHPKSIYLYKTRGGKYQFGPCWDFDWAFGYSPTYRATDGNSLSEQEAQELIAAARKYAEETFGPTSYYQWFEFNGDWLLWFGGNDFLAQTSDGWVQWPWGKTNYAPTYNNYLLGTGKNNGNSSNEYFNRVGNGGEFFLSIIMDNPEFMAVYKDEWTKFRNNIDAFWDALNDYARQLEPSAEKNHTVWPYAYATPADEELRPLTDGSYAGAIDALRRWLELRLDFMNDESKNYGLFDPNINYQRGQLSTK